MPDDPGSSVDVVRDGSDGREYAVVDGERVEIVKDPPGFDRYTPDQRRQIGEVYLMIAGLLPVEGRDYTVGFSFDSGSRGPRVTFRHLTPIGECFVRHAASSLGAKGR